MTLDCWFVDIAIKQNILQRIGNEGHSVLKLLLLTIPLILHPFFSLHVSYNNTHIYLFCKY